MNRQYRQQRPMMIALGGLSGTGKSSVGHALSLIIEDAVFLDSDVLRKKLHGVSPTTPLPDDAYTPEKQRTFKTHVRNAAHAELENYKIVVVTGTFLDEGSRKEQEAFAHSCGANFIGIFMKAPMKTVYDRVAGREGKTASDADIRIVDRQKTARTTPEKNSSWTVIDANQPFEKVVTDTVHAIDTAAKSMSRLTAAKNQSSASTAKNPSSASTAQGKRKKSQFQPK